MNNRIKYLSVGLFFSLLLLKRDLTRITAVSVIEKR